MNEEEAITRATESAGEPETGEASPAATRRRVWRNLVVLSVAATALAFVNWGTDVGFSAAIGCALGMLNYRWMHASLSNIIAVSGGEPPAKLQLAKFFLRWLVIAGVLFFASRVARLSVVAVVCGLFVLPLTVMVETFFQVAYLNGKRRAAK
jgi:hypothetical protein